MYKKFFQTSVQLCIKLKTLSRVKPTSSLGLVLPGSGAARTCGTEGSGAENSGGIYRLFSR